MNKKLWIIIFAIVAFIGMNDSVNASEKEPYYVTSKGIELTEKEYRLLKSNFDDYYINMFSEEVIVEALRNPKNVEFIKPDINENEIIPLLISCPSNSVCIDAGDHITTFSVIAIPSTKKIYLNMQTTWDKSSIPNILKSFDISAWMWNQTSGFVVTGIEAKQWTDGDSTSPLGYSYKGANSTYANNGYGVSMNIVNASKSYLKMDLEVAGYFTASKTYKFTGTYLHANQSVDRAQATGYTFNSSGLGNVVNFKDSNIKSKYTSYGSKSFTYTPPASMIK